MINIIYFCLLNILAIGTGYTLLSWSLKWSGSELLPLRTGAAYFIGMAFNIAIIRTLLTVFDNVDLALLIQLLLSISLCITFYKQLVSFSRELLSNKLVIYITVGGIICLPLILLFWLPDNSSPDNPFSIIGSLHSVRYAWVSNYISECGHIPVIGQNTGQSILSFMGGISGKRPYFFLFLWLYTSVFFLSVFIYGIVGLYENRARLVLLAVLIFMMGNSALSITHVLVIDSGSPFALNGYTDSLFGVFSVLMLLLFHAHLQKGMTNILPTFIVVTLICVANFFTAPQNMLYIFALIPLLILIAKISNTGMKVPIFWGSVLVFSALMAIPQGGMLTPKVMQTALDIPGLMSVQGYAGSQVKYRGVKVMPGTPFHFGSANEGWSSGQLSFLKEAQGYAANWKKNFFKIVWIFEQIFFTSLRVLFFPIVGIVVLFIMYRRNPDHVELKQKTITLPSYKVFYIFGGYTFIIGFIIEFSLMINGYKWELSRFLIPGMTIGMLGVSLCALTLFNKRWNYGRHWFVVLLFVITIGPTISLLVASVNNVRYSIRDNTFTTKFQTFLGKGPVIDHAYCRN
jgi:hypothetical protein